MQAEEATIGHQPLLQNLSSRVSLYPSESRPRSCFQITAAAGDADEPYIR